MSKANIHPQHLRKSGGKVKKFGGTVKQTGSKLEQTGQNLVSHASGDRSGVGSVVAKFTGKATEIAGKVLNEGGRVAEEAGSRLGKTADLYEEADTTAAKNLRRHHPDSKRKVDPPGGSKRAGSPVGKAGGSAKKPKRVPGGGVHSTEKVGGPSGGKGHRAPAIPGGGGEPARLKGRLPDPKSAEDRLRELLKRNNMTQEEFDSLRHRMNQPGGTANVTHDEAMKWRKLREDIPLEPDTPLQKVLSPKAVDDYLNGVVTKNFDYKQAKGCFARTVDVGHLSTPAEKYHALALNYPGTPFSEGMQSVHVLRTTATDVRSYEIPFGGTSPEGVANIEGSRLWSEPFNGNGVTRSGEHFVPEWDRLPSDLVDGDRIVRIDKDGSEHPVATFEAGEGWIPEGEG